MNTPRRLLTAFMLAGALLVAQSVAAEPSEDECISAIRVGQNLREAGKLLAARERFGVCVAMSCPPLLRGDCGKRLAAVVQATPTLVFEATDGAGNDLSSVHVTVDGAPLTDRLDGAAIPMDPGEHRFTFEAEGGPKNEKTIVVREGVRDRHERVVLGAASVAPPGVAAPPAAARSDGGTQRTIGFSLGGAGAVGIVVGSVLGLVASSTYNQAASGCRNGGTCTQADAQHGQYA